MLPKTRFYIIDSRCYIFVADSMVLTLTILVPIRIVNSNNLHTVLHSSKLLWLNFHFQQGIPLFNRQTEDGQNSQG